MSNPSVIYEHILRIRNIFLKDSMGRLLDLGSGNALVTKYFSNEGFNVFPVDIINRKPYFQKNYTKIDPEKNILPFKENYFDVVISNQVLNFILKKSLVLKSITEMCRVLKPCGKLVLTYMSSKNYFFEHCRKNNIFGKKTLVKLNNRIFVKKYYFNIHNEKKIYEVLRKNKLKIVHKGFFDYSICDIKRAHHRIILAEKNENA